MAMTGTERSRKSREKSIKNGLVRFRVDVAITQKQWGAINFEFAKLLARVIRENPPQ